MTEYWIDLESFSVSADSEKEASDEADKILKCQCGRDSEAVVCGIVEQ